MNSSIKIIVGKTILSSLVLTVITCSPSKSVLPNERISAVVTATIDGPVYEGNYYSVYTPATDYVFWVETKEGEYIKTLMVSNNMITDAENIECEAHLPRWRTSSGGILKSKPRKSDDHNHKKSFDGITSASLHFTGKSDTIINVIWDFSDSLGASVPEGEYIVYVETSNIEKYGTPPVYVPAKIKSEMAFTKIKTTTHEIVKCNGTKHIKDIKIAIVPAGASY